MSQECAEAVSLLEALDDAVDIVDRVDSWKDAVRRAGELLLARGKIRPEYIDAMIRVTEELGPYAVIAPGVALPHARPEDGALGIGLSLLVVKQPIYFGSPNDPVYIVIGFSAIDKKSHLCILKDLAELLQLDWLVEELKRTNSSSDIKNVIAKALELIKSRGGESPT